LITHNLTVALTQLHVENIRNLRQVRLLDLQHVNVFFGRNGSGKTSVLESIHLLGMARSFRGNGVKTLITHGEHGCTVFGMNTPVSSIGSGVPLGVHRSRVGETQIKMGGKAVRTVAELAHQLPLQVINAESFGLLTGSPAIRRQYLDWGVFHVEQQFFQQWQTFQRCIKQRNMLLRHAKIANQELATWTKHLAVAGAAINDYRKAYFQHLIPLFMEIMERLAPSLSDLSMQYRQGWDGALSYADALDAGISADLEQGYTHVGPQRADFRLTSGGHQAADTLSRGQQKLVVCGLKLAQGQAMEEQGRGKCTYLIDDLPSELDEVHSKLVCALLASMEAQVFITCVDQQEIQSVWPEQAELGLFHVEQGTVQSCTVA
jgi:DNA replication and repair protein RecF